MANGFLEFFPDQSIYCEREKMITSRLPAFRAKPISASKSNEILGRCTKYKYINQEMRETTDIDEYISRLVVECIVYPDLMDASLQAKYQVMTAVDLIGTMLLPGEYAELSQWILEICGFDKTGDQLVQEAKNA